LQVPAPLGTHVPVVEDPQLPDEHPIHPVQDFSMSQVVNKLEMVRVRVTVAKEVKVVDMSKAMKIKVRLILNSSGAQTKPYNQTKS
jgi:hypothetical protein